MRVEFIQAITQLHDQCPDLVFLTGDVGFAALEGLQKRMGNHFINAGVAEQNMLTMAAAIAQEGFPTWVYSISPFVTLRPYEQIRNDVCLHRLPVKIVGNGGGYGYGIMGATHHNLGDIAAMRLLPNMRVYVPFSSSDVPEVVQTMHRDPHPNYLRLNLPACIPDVVPAFAPWRRLRQGHRATVIGTGPILQNICLLPESTDFDIWTVGVLPLDPLPSDLLRSVQHTRRVIIIEEHSAQCGLAEAIALPLLSQIDGRIRILPLAAAGYPSGRYGSQQFHQKESGLAGHALQSRISEFMNTSADAP